MTTVVTTNPNTKVDSGTVTVVKKGTGEVVSQTSYSGGKVVSHRKGGGSTGGIGGATPTVSKPSETLPQTVWNPKTQSWVDLSTHKILASGEVVSRGTPEGFTRRGIASPFSQKIFATPEEYETARKQEETYQAYRSAFAQAYGTKWEQEIVPSFQKAYFKQEALKGVGAKTPLEAQEERRKFLQPYARPYAEVLTGAVKEKKMGIVFPSMVTKPILPSKIARVEAEKPVTDFWKTFTITGEEKGFRPYIEQMFIPQVSGEAIKVSEYSSVQKRLAQLYSEEIAPSEKIRGKVTPIITESQKIQREAEKQRLLSKKAEIEADKVFMERYKLLAEKRPDVLARTEVGTALVPISWSVGGVLAKPTLTGLERATTRVEKVGLSVMKVKEIARQGETALFKGREVGFYKVKSIFRPEKMVQVEADITGISRKGVTYITERGKIKTGAIGRPTEFRARAGALSLGETKAPIDIRSTIDYYGVEVKAPTVRRYVPLQEYYGLGKTRIGYKGTTEFTMGRGMQQKWYAEEGLIRYTGIDISGIIKKGAKPTVTRTITEYRTGIKKPVMEEFGYRPSGTRTITGVEVMPKLELPTPTTEMVIPKTKAGMGFAIPKAPTTTRTMEKEMVIPRLSPMIKTRTLPRTKVGILSTPKVEPIQEPMITPSRITMFKPVTRPRLTTIQMPKLQETPMITTITTPKMFFPPPTKVPKTPQMPLPTLPIVPFGFGAGVPSRIKGFAPRYKRKAGYTPTLYSAFSGIRAKLPKGIGGKTFTGMEVRPMELFKKSRRKKKR
jgi:hypothetical protein